MNDYKNGVASFIVPEYFEDVRDINNVFCKSIAGILDQSDQNFKIIIIDNCSPKKVYCQVANFINNLNDKRIHLIRCSKSKGLGHCRNIGIEYAHKIGSPFILYNDAGDISHPFRLEEVRKIFSLFDDTDVVYGSFVPIDENDEKIAYGKLFSSLKSIIIGNQNNPINEKNALIRLGTEKNYTNLTSSTAVKTSLAYKYKFPKYKISEDTYTWYQYAANGGLFYYSPNIPTMHRVKIHENTNKKGNKSDFCKTKLKVDEKGFKRALDIYSKKNLLLKNEKEKILHDFYICLFNNIKDNANKKTLFKLNKKIKKHSGFLEINILDNRRYVLQVIVPQNEGGIGGSDTHVLNLSTIQKEKSSYSPIVLFTRNTEYLTRIKDLNISRV